MLSSVGWDTHSASFAAWAYMSLALPLEMRHEGYNVSNPKVSYNDFVNELDSGQTVNADYATTSTPRQVQTDFKVIQGLSNQGADEYALVQKAYELGMVNPSTGLLSSQFDTKG